MKAAVFKLGFTLGSWPGTDGGTRGHALVEAGHSALADCGARCDGPFPYSTHSCPSLRLRTVAQNSAQYARNEEEEDDGDRRPSTSYVSSQLAAGPQRALPLARVAEKGKNGELPDVAKLAGTPIRGPLEGGP